MNDMLVAMSRDMNINRFESETSESFVFRLCYSALGQWCLYSALSCSDGLIGATKHNQSIVLKDVLKCYCEIFPCISKRFIDDSKTAIDFSVHVRRLYEETGYLISDDNNRNQLANFGRYIELGKSALFFGIPNSLTGVNGLGVFSDNGLMKVSRQDFLIRDKMTYREYIKAQFDAVDFVERSMDVSELEFFNPSLNKSPSTSWERIMQTDWAMARNVKTNLFYKVMRESGKLLFADLPRDKRIDTLTSREYKRLYLALKAQYGKPVIANIINKDKTYYQIKLGGHLPNREYYYLLLLSWPTNNAFDKINFTIHKDLLPPAILALEDLGIEIRGGHSNVQ